ncbi:MAG: transglutaminase-like domain-containing protein [Lachnospiraceae bacterium]|nr:transglutaminase-like domain-containing protein [Lachnospiraceae bacterium]
MRLAGKIIKNDKRNIADQNVKSNFTIMHQDSAKNGMFLLILTVIWGMLSSVMCFVTSFELETEPYKIGITIIVTALVSWICASLKKIGNIVTTILFMCYIMLFVFLVVTEKEQFMVLNNDVMGTINKVYFTSFFEFDISKSVIQNTDYTIAVMYIASLLTFLLNIFVSIKYNIIMCLIITFVPAFFGFTFTLMPNVVWFIAYIGFLIGLFLKNNVSTDFSGNINGNFQKRGKEYVLKDDIGYGKDVFIATVCIGISVAIISFTTMIFIPLDSYERPGILEDVRQSFEKGIVFIQNNIWGSRNATGGISGGKLGDVSNIIFSENTELECELPYTGQNIYLRTYIGSEYTGRSFEPLSDEVYMEYADEFEHLKNDKFNSLTMTCDILKKLEGQNVFYTDNGDAIHSYVGDIKIKNASKRHSYIPYYTNVISDDNVNIEDGFMKKISSKYTIPIYWIENDAKYDVISEYGSYKRYTDDYEFFGDESMRSVTSEGLERYFDDEKIYRDIVNDVYTRLPDNISSDIIDNMRQYDILTNDDILSLIGNLQDYYNKNFTYTLSPGVVPKDEDVVEYFLYKTKKGYCTYFAASSVILLRAAGIPARYVEGYVVKQKDYTDKTKIEDGNIQIGKVNIKDSSAHAWTEVYINGYGWLPVDFTPGYQEEFRASGVVHTEEETENMTTEEETETLEEQTKQQNETKQDNTHETITEEETKADTQNVANGGDKKEYYILAAIKKLGIIILYIIAVMTIIWIYHATVIVMMKLRLNKADRDRKVKIIYRRMEKLLELVDIKKEKSESYPDFAKRTEESVKVFAQGVFIKCVQMIESIEYGNHKVTESECIYFENALKTAQKRVTSYMGIMRRIIYKYFINRLGI